MESGTLVGMEKLGKVTFRKKSWADFSRVLLFDSRTISCSKNIQKVGTVEEKILCQSE